MSVIKVFQVLFSSLNPKVRKLSTLLFSTSSINTFHDLYSSALETLETFMEGQQRKWDKPIRKVRHWFKGSCEVAFLVVLEGISSLPHHRLPSRYKPSTILDCYVVLQNKDKSIK